MRGKLIKPEAEGRKYPCLVIEKTVGDGQKPTVYLKPNKFVSIVMVGGYLEMQGFEKVGDIIDARDPKVIEDSGLDDGEGIHENLPLFHGKVQLENGDL
jgi:hypothetical protein